MPGDANNTSSKEPKQEVIADINLVSSFLANSQADGLESIPNIDTIVLCASSVLNPAENVFRALETNPSLTKTLVLCGGIGHSTKLVQLAAARKYPGTNYDDLAEAEVLSKILTNNFNVDLIKSKGLKIHLEPKSTNCKTNAVETRKVLDLASGTSPKRLVLIQDPTMSIRTKAGFDQVYSDLPVPPEVITYPTFTPKFTNDFGGNMVYDVKEIRAEELWDMERILSLLMNEIPRLKLYGPSGTGDIVHVEVPHNVQEAYERLKINLDFEGLSGGAGWRR